VSHVPVIMLTAKATDDDRIEGFKTRADAYLTKPFNEEELQVRIEQLLESRAKLQKIYSQMMLSDAAGEATNGVDQGDLFLTKLQMAINLHLDDNSDISTILAEEMCLSKSQLYRKLKAISGGTVSSLVMQTRLNRAKLMLEKAVSIKEVAFACGFDNPSYFARCFKEQFGVSPSQFLSTSQK
jgi:AraC-like DNA-binding protein